MGIEEKMNIIRLPQRNFQIIPNSISITSLREAKDIFILNCKAKNLSERTISFYNEKIALFEKFLSENYSYLDLNSITPNIIKDFICYLQSKNLSSYTVRGTVIAIKVFIKFLCDEEYIQTNPCEKIQIPKVQKRIIKPLSETEIKNLLTTFNVKTFTGFRNYLMVLIFLDTGIRLSELLTLRIKDIDWSRYTFLILGKGNKEREVCFGMRVAKTFIKYLKWRGEIPGQDCVFVDRFGQMMKKRHIQKIIQEAGRKAGIERLHPHRLRHSCAISWIRNGGDAFSLQRILGHNSLEMVRNYVNLANDDVLIKHKKFGLLDNLELNKR